MASLATVSILLLVPLGRLDEAEERFESARALGQRVRSRPFTVRTDVAHAEMLLRHRSGDDERARSLLVEARQAAEEMGMDGIVRQATELLARVGERTA